MLFLRWHLHETGRHDLVVNTEKKWKIKKKYVSLDDIILNIYSIAPTVPHEER